MGTRYSPPTRADHNSFGDRALQPFQRMMGNRRVRSLAPDLSDLSDREEDGRNLNKAQIRLESAKIDAGIFVEKAARVASEKKKPVVRAILFAILLLSVSWLVLYLGLREAIEGMLPVREDSSPGNRWIGRVKVENCVDFSLSRNESGGVIYFSPSLGVTGTKPYEPGLRDSRNGYAPIPSLDRAGVSRRRNVTLSSVRDQLDLACGVPGEGRCTCMSALEVGLWLNAMWIEGGHREGPAMLESLLSATGIGRSDYGGEEDCETEEEEEEEGNEDAGTSLHGTGHLALGPRIVHRGSEKVEAEIVLPGSEAPERREFSMRVEVAYCDHGTGLMARRTFEGEVAVCLQSSLDIPDR